jgi:stearoyl-CoA desaturase (delta-9 desaturase)
LTPAAPVERITEARPWERAWWKPAEGNLWVLLHLAAIHSLALAGLILFPIPGWKVFLAALACTMAGGVGTTVCYHRYLAHKTFRMNPVLEQILIFFAVANGSGTPLSWAANHRAHHSTADTEDDVSSPRYGGFWWAHLRWLYQWPAGNVDRWCRDLNRRRYWIWNYLQAAVILLSLLGGGVMGWKGLFWIGPIRLVYSLHMQCFVNSLLHLPAKKLPEGADSSRNIWWLGPFQLTAWGENYHKNHHALPRAARFGRAWYQIDVGWYTICLFRTLGLVTDVYADGGRGPLPSA